MARMFRVYSGGGPGFIRVIGIRNAAGLVANFQGAQEEIAEAVRRVIRKNARVHRDTARSIAPIRTGRLRRSITFELSEGGLVYRVFPDPEVFTAEGQPYYPVFVELGTVKMAARPYLLPSMRLMEPIVREDVKRAVTRAAQRMTRRRGAA